MRILVVGAGAVGGYFGGRLLEAGADVTFLVRARRAAELARSGLVVRSHAGDLHLPDPPTVLSGDLPSKTIDRAYDLIVLSCKAYDLENAMDSFAAAVGAGTAILPLLNGMRHLDSLDERFGRDRVLGGQCLIAAALNEEREVVHLNDKHELSFGERDRASSDRTTQIKDAMGKARFDLRASPEIVLEMWAKWVYLASLASGTCLMRASVGDIVASPGGTALMLQLVEECTRIALAAGFQVPADALERTRMMVTERGSGLTASMLRDLEQNHAIEADHVVGDLLRRGEQTGAIAKELTVLHLAYTHLKAYETRRLQALGGA